MKPIADQRAIAFAVLTAMPLFFSSNLIIGRAAIESVEPFTLAFLRWAIAFLILLPFAAMSLTQHRKTLLSQMWLISIMGLLGMWICGAGVYWALRFTTATNGTLIYTSSPVLILILERIFRGRQISHAEWVGIVLAISGVFTIIAKGSLSAILLMQLNSGDLIFAIAAISWAVYSVLLRRREFAHVPTISLFACLALAGAVSLLPFMGLEIAATGAFPATAKAWLSIFGVASVSSVLAFGCFQYGIKVVGPSTTGLFMYLLPPYGVLMAALFLGEELHRYHVTGFVLIMTGLILATAPKAWITARLGRMPLKSAKEREL